MRAMQIAASYKPRMTGGGGIVTRVAVQPTSITVRPAGQMFVDGTRAGFNNGTWGAPITILRPDANGVLIPSRVFPNSQITYRNARGATRSEDGYCETTPPRIDPRTGRRMQGFVTCWAPGYAGPIPSDRIIGTRVRPLTDLVPASDEGRPYELGAANRRAGQLNLTLTDAQFEEASAAKDALTAAASKSGDPNPVAGLSDQALGSLFSNIGGVLGTTAAAVSAAIVSGNQVEIARIQGATQRYIADMQRQGRMQEAAAASALNTSLVNNGGYIQPPPPSSTWTSTDTALAVTAAAAVLVIGALLLTRRTRKNPVISNGTNRFFAKTDVAAHYLDDAGYSIVGKTSSTRRRRRAA